MPSGYVDLGYSPGKDDVVCMFYVEPASGVTLEKAAIDLTAESSIGTWTEICTMNDSIWCKLKPTIFGINEKTNMVKVAYPLALFELGSIPQLMSSVTGNIYGMKALDNLRVLDISVPKKYVKSFLGPRFGIPGIRKLLKVPKRPLVGTIIKPKVGLGPKDHARVAYEAWVGGCDVVKDDENLTDQSFNRFDARVRLTLAALRKAQTETGERKVYMANITAETNEMIRRMKYVKKQGGTYAMVDVLTIGPSALQTVREENEDLKLVLHAHRAMHAAITRNKRHGITMLALAKIYRLIGMDQLHIGTAVGKMEGPKPEVMSIRDEIVQDRVPETEDRLAQEWHGTKSIFPVASGGLHPGHVPKLMEFMGNDVIIQMGGGIHGHPQGTTKGAMAARQAVDAVLEGKTMADHAHTHQELALAIQKWGK
ncbi:MAG: type III ribulose-bisphosphate carboxylase [Candidatus Altiarchaeota archaeon]